MASRYGLQIRAAGPGDARGIAELAATTGIVVDAHGIETRIEAFRGGRGALLLAEEWGPPSGLVALAFAPSLATDRPVALIDALLVGPDDRRRGIGRLLLKAAAQSARAAGCGDLLLAVSPGSAELEAFGLATGFEPMASLHRRALRKRA